MTSRQCKAWTELEDQAPPLTLQAFPDRLSYAWGQQVHNQVAIHEPSASSQMS